MPEPFTITAASTGIQLDPDRRGKASFTVSNATGLPIRGQALLQAEESAAGAWLSLDGDAERDFDTTTTQQFTAQIAVPPDAPPQGYTFRLDMVGVENPDELYSRGPSVTFEVPKLEPVDEPRPWWIVAVVVGVLVVGGIIAAIVLGSRSVQVPIVAESTITDATEVLEAAKLRIAGETREAYSDEIAAGRVIGTDPSAGQEVRRRTLVTLIVSNGPQPVTLPDVDDRTRADAREILENACARDPCVEVIVQLEPSRTVERGRVIATDPEKGTDVPQGSEVTLVVSSGLPTVRIPELTGATIAQAESKLTALELQPGSMSSEKSIDIPEDQVIRTDPPAGTEVEIDTSVALVVSSGPPIVVRYLIKNENGRLVPDLIRAWEIQGDTATLFLLREAIEITDGRPWTAQTVGRMIERDPSIMQFLSSIDVIDDYTLRLEAELFLFGTFPRQLIPELAKFKIPVYTTE